MKVKVKFDDPLDEHRPPRREISRSACRMGVQGIPPPAPKHTLRARCCALAAALAAARAAALAVSMTEMMATVVIIGTIAIIAIIGVIATIGIIGIFPHSPEGHFARDISQTPHLKWSVCTDWAGGWGLGGANKPWICAPQLFRTLRLRPVAVAGAEAVGPQPIKKVHTIKRGGSFH